MYVQFVEDSIDYWLNSADQFQPEMAVYDAAVCLHEQLLFLLSSVISIVRELFTDLIPIPFLPRIQLDQRLYYCFLVISCMGGMSFN